MTAAATSPKVESTRLADQLERSFRGGAWHGPSIEESLAGLSAAATARRTTAGAHTIAEIVAHLAFWLEHAWRRIDGAGDEGLSEGDDWPQSGEGEAGWRALLARLDAAHRRLHAQVEALDDAALDGPVAGSDPTVRGLLHGILQHNAYHGGQIVLLAKAAEDGAPR
jgi:uncharacterized damage-inducible protein DinB